MFFISSSQPNNHTTIFHIFLIIQAGTEQTEQIPIANP